MRIKKQASWDVFNIEGITYGKLLAIQEAMLYKQEKSELSPTQTDVLKKLDSAIRQYANTTNSWTH